MQAVVEGKGQEVDLTRILTQPLFILETTRALSLLRQFKATGVHVAIIQDEFGGVQGIATLNDIFESIVGSMPEFGDQEEPDIVVREDGSWLVNGSLATDEFRAHFPQCPPDLEHQGGYETLGGFVMTQLGHIPTAGEHFNCGRLRFEIIDMDERRVDKVLIQLIPEASESSEAAPDQEI
jgi:putative hemolysin